jgi:hypothetical protein
MSTWQRLEGRLDVSPEYDVFLKFYYPEIKDLTIKFLTLVSSVFTLSVVFAEKVVILTPPTSKRLIPIVSSWILFVIAFVLGGYGLWKLFVLGEIANGVLLTYEYKGTFAGRLEHVHLALNVAGVSFVLGLIGLGISAGTKLVHVTSHK